VQRKLLTRKERDHLVTILTPKGYSPARRSSSDKPETPPPAEAVQPVEAQAEPAQEPAGRGQPPRIQLTFPPQVVGITCPNCGTPYPAQIFSVIDVGQDPVVKSALLAGQINVAVCPRCGAGGAIGTPLLYHDPAHSFLGVYVPQQVPVNEQQKVIGDLSRRLMDGLPQEARRGYMLTPKQFLTYQSLLEAILEHEGITKEMLDKQRRQVQLVEQALTALSDPEGLKMLVKERDAEMDDEFFGLLANLIDSSASAGDADAARQILDLRERLIGLTTWGQRVQKQREAVAQLTPETTRDQLLDMIIAADDERVVDALVMAGRPLVDYGFYQALAGRIEGAEQRGAADEAKRLDDLRERILKFIEQLEQLQRAAVQQYSQMLGEILGADDLDQALAERAGYIDQNFLSVLATNLQEAERRGATGAVRRLQEVWDKAVDLINAGSPPEVRLLNELLDAEYPSGTRKLLAENRPAITPEFVESLAVLADQMEADGAPDLAKKLRQIRSQAQLMR
jgi:hypothetical protein